MYMVDPESERQRVVTAPDAGFAIGVAALGLFYLGLYPTAVYDLTRSLNTTLQALAALWLS